MTTTTIPLPTAAPITCGARTLVMGIINCTPDSLFGRNFHINDALDTAAGMIEDGADIIDIGGESTRPGSLPVSLDEELSRVIPVITALRRQFPLIPISIDTTKSQVARAAVDSGADIINDISALGFDPGMTAAAAGTGAALCLMHIQGTPANMQHNPSYDTDIIDAVITFLRQRTRLASDAGVLPSKIIIDPGIGFGKTLQHNLEILSRLSALRVLPHPILIGASRKSFIGTILGTDTSARLEGSLSAAVAAIATGADIVRVHDVRETIRAVRVADAILRHSSREALINA